jgi:hypothetical protein
MGSATLSAPSFASLSFEDKVDRGQIACTAGFETYIRSERDAAQIRKKILGICTYPLAVSELKEYA